MPALAPRAADESDAAGDDAAQGAAEAGEEARTTPLVGLGRKADGEGCGWHLGRDYLHKIPAMSRKMSVIRYIYLICVACPPHLPGTQRAAATGNILRQSCASYGSVHRDSMKVRSLPSAGVRP